MEIIASVGEEIRSLNFSLILPSIYESALTLFHFEYTLYRYIHLHERYRPISSGGYFDDDLWAKVQIYSLSLIFKLWSKKHYRTSSYQQDLKDNLKYVYVCMYLQCLRMKINFIDNCMPFIIACVMTP